MNNYDYDENFDDDYNQNDYHRRLINEYESDGLLYSDDIEGQDDWEAWARFINNL